MSIEKMSLVTLKGDRATLDETLLQCTSSGCFHPEMASNLTEYASGITAMREENPYAQVLKSLTEISEITETKLNFADYSNLNLTTTEFTHYVSKLGKNIAKLQKRKAGVEKLIDSHNQTLAHLEHLTKLGDNFDDLFGCEYLHVRFGKLPIESYEKLHYYNDKPFILFTYDNDGTHHWCLYIFADHHKQEVDGLFTSLFFERIRIPDYAHGTPAESIEFIKKDLKRETEELITIDKEINDFMENDKEKLDMIYTKCKILASSFDMRKYAAFIKDMDVSGSDSAGQDENDKYHIGAKDKFVLVGFIPENEEEKFKRLIGGMEFDVEITVRPADADIRLKPPVKLKNSKLLRPFEMLVNIYGLPGYKDIDPTPFVGFTYILLFGIMFGDVGQGLLFALMGYILHKKNGGQLYQILMRIGISSSVFGFFYGSTFGNETWLMPVHQAIFGRSHFIHTMDPASTNTILVFAVVLGICIILASMSINIILGFKRKNMEKALFSHNGVAGVIFYLATLLGVAGDMVLGLNLLTPAYIACLIVLPITIVFFKEPLGHILQKKAAFPHGFGAFFVESFFEMFEILLGFISNTMSFLRVGGFILSHAGMMLVVLTLSEMVTGIGSIIIFIIGNLFVMGLEGMIVGIQVLRLEFYEIFSRFFDGDGNAFTPIKVSGITESNS